MNEKQLQALIRKNQARAGKQPKGGRRWQDPTIAQSPERDDNDAKEIFKEMKRREF
ncbi:MAG: hypothetical protein ACT4OZ_16490 [Gemmatimonadota bacterium]